MPRREFADAFEPEVRERMTQYLEPEAPRLLKDLELAMRRHMLPALPGDQTAKLEEKEFRALHSIYATWRRRVPKPMPRRVHVSRELRTNQWLDDVRDGLAAIEREIASGAKLFPRMSTAIEHAYGPPGDRRPLDRLLADWGIHHLHLGTEPRPNRPGFVARTGLVLLVAFLEEDAYLIDLRPHERDGANWAELEILRIVVRNWPGAGILRASNSAVGLTQEWSDAERRELREAGIAGGVVEIDGQVWSAGGQSLGGTPLSVEQHCMATSWFLSGYEPTEDALRGELRAIAEKHCVPDDWYVHVDGDDYGFISGGVFVCYGSLVP